LKAKFTRLPYKDSSTPRSDPGLRLFGDIQGKFPESFGGKIYSFPLLDDGSGLIIPTFLSLKSEASKTLQFVVNHLNNAFPHRKVAFFQSEVKNLYQKSYQSSWKKKASKMNFLLLILLKAMDVLKRSIDY
jgi:hypothetical protein